jgi:4-oxalocrotonate tautomerase
MPHISIKMYPGRTEEVKKDLAEKTKDFICQEMNMEEKYISVSVEEIEKDNEEVVDKINPDDLYVKANF